MKTIFNYIIFKVIYIVSALLLLTTQVFAQETGGGNNNSEATRTEVKPAEIVKGVYSGDVNAFTGTYNGSIDLGTVSTYSNGLSYTASMSYSSSYSISDVAPAIQGVPYGEGWNISVPSISVSYRTYNKYSKQEMVDINRSGLTNPTADLTFDEDEILKEGKPYWLNPILNIPGVANGRMIYVGEKDDISIFTLQVFERYIEATFDGVFWKIYLDDGTLYEMSPYMITQRGAANQRMHPELYNSKSLGSSILPTNDVASWYCKRISKSDEAQYIQFKYEFLGKDNSFTELYSYHANLGYGFDLSRGYKYLRDAYKDVILLEIDAGGAERLVFNYGVEEFANAEHILYESEEGVDKVDAMYMKKIEEHFEFATSREGWLRYDHIRKNHFLDFDLLSTEEKNARDYGTYPYFSPLDGDDAEWESSKNALKFNHTVLESPSISSLHFGEKYELIAEIKDENRNDVSSLYDINIVTGPIGDPNFYKSKICTRSKSIFSTFNQAIKWNLCCENAVIPSKVREDFVYPGLLDEFHGLYIQIGPSNATIKHDVKKSFIGCIPDNREYYRLYYNTTCQTADDGSSTIPSGSASTDGAPGYFGAGIPWHMTIDNFYGVSNPSYIGFCDVSENYELSHLNNFWWENYNDDSECDLVNEEDNNPTMSDESVYLTDIKLIRHSKTAYMLKSVSKQVRYGDDIENYMNGQNLEGWATTTKLNFEYDLKKQKHYLRIDNWGDEEEIGDIDVILLTKVVQSVNYEDAELLTLEDRITHQIKGGEPAQVGTNLNGITYHFEYTNTAFENSTSFSKDIRGHYLLHKAINPLGNEITVHYDRLNGYIKNSYIFPPNQYSQGYPEYKTCIGINRTIPSIDEPNVHAMHARVGSVESSDCEGSIWHTYTYENPSTHESTPPIKSNYELSVNEKDKSYGFGKTTIKGPVRNLNDDGPETTLIHFTDYLKWGKLESVTKKDLTGVLISETTNSFELVEAFEHASLRDLESDPFCTIGTAYEDYRNSSRPELGGSSYPNYFTDVRNWLASNSIDFLQLDAYEAGLTMANVSKDELLYDVLTTKFYELTEAEHLTNNPQKQKSYFLKKTQDENKSFDSYGNYLSTINTYEYYDARYDGVTTSQMYDKLFSENGNDKPTILTAHPSWQLASITTSSPQLPGQSTRKEFYYLWDLMNLHWFKDNTDKATQIRASWSHRNRTNVFEEKVISKSPSDDEVVNCTYYEYGFNNVPESIEGQTYVLENDGIPCGAEYYNGELCYREGHFPVQYECLEEVDIGKSYSLFCPCETQVHQTGIEDEYELSEPEENEVDSPLGSLPIAYYDPCNSSQSSTTISDIYTYGKLKVKAKYIKVGESASAKDAIVFDTYSAELKPNLPYDTIQTYRVLLYNEIGQIILDQNERGIITKYHYPKIDRLIVPYCDGLEESTITYWHSRNQKVPASIEVGYGRDDAFVTHYTYTPENYVSSVTTPEGMTKQYFYDEYGRLHAAYRNGTLISKVEYNYWDGSPAATFKEKTLQNYVKVSSFTEVGAAPYGSQNFIDPLGRSVGTHEFSDYHQVMSSDIIFDMYGRVRLSIPRQNGVEPSITSSSGFKNPAYEEFDYYAAPRNTIQKSSKYGLSIDDNHTVESDYKIVELNLMEQALSAADQTLIPPGTHFSKSTTIDEDGKKSITYTNAIGQLIAQISGDNYAATSFTFTSHGQIKEISNPKNQISLFVFNHLGQLYSKSNPDEGTSMFGYDHSGLPVMNIQGNGQKRMHVYDLYGRKVKQVRKDNLDSDDILVSKGMPWKLDENTHDKYATFFSTHNSMSDETNASVFLEKLWVYDKLSPKDKTGLSPIALLYVNKSLTHAKGQLVKKASCNKEGYIVESTFFSYNQGGYLKWELKQFDEQGKSGGYMNRIDYTSYNLQGSPLRQAIDLNCDRTVDFIYSYDYDLNNRLSTSYASFDGIDSFKIAHFVYDNLKGLLKEKQLFASGNKPLSDDCKDVMIDNVIYDYDERYRLFGINSNLFDWDLGYDDNTISGEQGNYNGNINNAQGSFDFNDYNVINAPEYSAHGSFYGLTSSYTYSYDALNRLTSANSNIQPMNGYIGNIDLTKLGDVSYIYDIVGNLQTLNRQEVKISSNGQLNFNIPYTYSYASSNNHLNNVSWPLGTYLSDGINYRNYTYDAGGSLTNDSYRKVADVNYLWSNLPWKMGLFRGRELQHLYSADDARIWKREKTPVSTNNACVLASDYYLTDASGQTLAIIDLDCEKSSWFAFGGERIAKIDHPLGLQFESPDIIPGSECPPGYVYHPGQKKCLKLINNSRGSEDYFWQPATNSDVGGNSTPSTEAQSLVNTLSKVYNPQSQTLNGKWSFPDKLLVGKNGQNTELRLASELSTYPFSASTTIRDTFPLNSPFQQFELTNPINGYKQTYHLYEFTSERTISGDPGHREVDPTFPPNKDPYDVDMDVPIDPPTPEYDFYIYDHLGNTRLVYKPSVCNDADEVIYDIQQMVDYYPYGKILQQHGSADERYLTTQHERDNETGMDYRGARFYDADVARFLSVDPLASDFAAWSPYNYVLGNPISLVDPDGRTPCPPGVDCADPLPNMERIRSNRASNLGPGNTRNGGRRFHSGHDLYAASGTDVRSVMDGTIIATGYSSSYGNYITVEHNVCVTCEDGGETIAEATTFFSFYSHLSEVDVELDQVVKVGESIGETGTTGNARGMSGIEEHLHFELGTQRRTATSPFLDQGSLVDPNLAYKSVEFFSSNATANQSQTGVLKRVIKGGYVRQIVNQGFNNTSTLGVDRLEFGRPNALRGLGGVRYD